MSQVFKSTYLAHGKILRPRCRSMTRLYHVELRMFRCRSPCDLFADPLKHHVKQWDQKNPEKRCRNHSREYRGADAAPAELSGAGSDDQRHQPRDEGKTRHHDGAEAFARAFERGILDG